MKTPREILLKRHEPSAGKLDAVRQRAMREAFPEKQKHDRDESWLMRIVNTIWRELILPVRGVWAGFAAVWVGLMLVNMAVNSGEARVPVMASAKPAEVMMTFREEKQLMVELTGRMEFKDAEPPKKSAPQPRSELQLKQIIV